jgi:hypothetical protein
MAILVLTCFLSQSRLLLYEFASCLHQLLSKKDGLGLSASDIDSGVISSSKSSRQAHALKDRNSTVALLRQIVNLGILRK